MMKRKFATKTKKKKNQNSSSNLTMQQQQTSEKRTYQSISRASLSPSLHANNTHVTESHRFGKKKRSLTRSPHNNRLRCCKNKTPRRRLPTRRKNSVPKRTQNQNRQKKKKVKKIHSTSVYRKLLKLDHKRNQQQRKHNDV